MFRMINIQPYQRGLRYRAGAFIAVLNPGQHTFYSPPWDPKLEAVDVVDVRELRFEHADLAHLVEDMELREQLKVILLTEGQRGVVYRAGQVVDFIDAGLHAYWNLDGLVRIEVADEKAAPMQSLVATR